MVDPSMKKKKRIRVESNNNDNIAPSAISATLPSHAPPQLSAIAARKLALAQQTASTKDEAEVVTPIAAPVSVAAPVSPSPFSPSSSDNDDEIANLTSSDNNAPVASTSKLPSHARKERESGIKRYYNAAPPSSTNENENEDTDVTFDRSAAEEDVSDPESSSAAVNASHGRAAHHYNSGEARSQVGRRSKRRRRNGEDGRNAFFDPSCVSNWRPTHLANFFPLEAGPSAKAVVLALHPGETILAKGVYTLTVLRGSIRINNAILSSSSKSLTIFAPTTHPLPVIHASSFPTPTNSGPREPIRLSLPMEFEHPLPEYPVVITLQDVDTGVEELEKVCRTAGMPIRSGGMWASRENGMQQAVFGNTFEVITMPERDITQTILPDNWRAVLDDLAHLAPTFADESSMHEDTPLVCVVQGPKGTGKSTFGKMLVNTLMTHRPTTPLARVAYLDTDIGQTELAPPGVLSLHLLDSPLIGPSFTHLHHQPIRAHYLGAITPKNNPSLYLAAIQDLLNTYCALLNGDLDVTASIPLVVNTQGWTKGLGADLLSELHQMVGRCFEGRHLRIKIFDFSSNNAPQFGSGYDTSIPHDVGPSSMLEGMEDIQIIPVQPIYLPEHGPVRLTPADLRTLSLISYLHLDPSSFSSNSGGQREPAWNFSTSLVRKKPYEVPWSTFREIKLLGSEELPYEEILRALDVSLVALVETDGNSLPEASSESSRTLPYRPEDGSTSNPGSSRCIGLGIIRAIDTSTSSIYMLSPLPASHLEKINSLHKGDIEIPTVLMVDYAGEKPEDKEEEGVCGVDWKDVPYLEGRGETSQGVGNAKRRVRRNVMRRSQF